MNEENTQPQEIKEEVVNQEVVIEPTVLEPVAEPDTTQSNKVAATVEGAVITEAEIIS